MNRLELHADIEMTTLQAIQPFTKAEPDKEMKLEKAKVSLYGLPNNTVIAHEMCEPGWKWTTHSKPHSGTDLCHRSHTGFMTKGCLVCQWPDGRKVGNACLFALQ